MKKINVFLEIEGTDVKVGELVGESSKDAHFTYDVDYQKKYNTPISIGLPLGEDTFSVDSTRAFFEGLLPEGFTRKTVAEKLHASEDDYVDILSKLGNDCLGAVRLSEEGVAVGEAGYNPILHDEIKALAAEGAIKASAVLVKTHLSLTGASGKVGLYYDENKDKWYLPVGRAPSTHIVKQSHVRLRNIVLNEQLCMECARELGLDTPESFILSVGDYRDENILFATKRYDRKVDEKSKITSGMPTPYRCHQEDFAQALGINSTDKYESEKKDYIHRAFTLIRGYSVVPLADQLKLWKYIVFNLLIGNTDAHLKNYSLLYSKDLKTVRLAPLYDVICTQIYDESTSEMSMYYGEEKEIEKINETSIKKAALEAGLGVDLSLREYDRMKHAILPALEKARKKLENQGVAEISDVADKVAESIDLRISSKI